MLRRGTRPTPEELVIPDDIDEAILVRSEVQAERRRLSQKLPFIDRVSNIIIDRQGRNHYIETLFFYSPGGIS